MSATVRSAVAIICGEHRVFFELPATGFGPDELDALENAIKHARRLLASECDNQKPLVPQLPEPCG